MTTEITCTNCNHKWETKSELVKVTCPSCNFKTFNNLKENEKSKKS